MAGIGDKYVIEISDIFTDGDGSKLFKIKGFNSLVFDYHGLGKLSRLDDEINLVRDKVLKEVGNKRYSEGYTDGAYAQLRECENVMMDYISVSNDKEFLKGYYGLASLRDVLKTHNLEDVIKDYKERDEHVISVGDVVEVPGMCKRAIVTMVVGNQCHLVGKNFKGDLDISLVKYLGENKDLFN